MRALRRWTRKAKCRLKYGKACPHGGHYGGKRRNRMSAVQPLTHAGSDAKEHREPAHKATKRASAKVKADA
jgi:hypothetical protein